MKFGISAATFDLKFGPVVFKGSSISDTLRTVRSYDYDGVDLFLHELSEAEQTELRRGLEETGLGAGMVAAIWVAESGGSLTDPSPENRRRFVDLLTKHIQLTGQLGGVVPIGFLRGRQDDRTDDDYYGMLAESLRALAAAAAEAGTVLVLEPINRYEIDTFPTVGSALAFLDQYGLDDVQLLPDAFHMNIEEADIFEAFRSATGRIGHIHASDTNRYAPGTGHLDYSALFRVLREIGYDGYLAVESPPVPSADECARSAIRHLRKMAQR